MVQDRGARSYLDLEVAPAAEWPLWSAPLRTGEEMILALGIWDYGAGAVRRHFPVQEPRLAFTASALLARVGETRRSILIAEVLENQIPKRIPELLRGEELGRLLYPLAHGELLVRESRRQGVDPLLLASIIREESRYDAAALSAASARGLTQFVQPTAQRIARQLGLPQVSPADLYRPEVSIALGAAYLGELGRRYDGTAPQVVAAYNAGEPQAELWRSYCRSAEVEEYYTKVGFSETRGYLTRVLGSWARYHSLYRPEPPEEGAEDEGASNLSTGAGSSAGSSSR
jgi:soluble lytic murein transglycosylase